ncbi:MAG: hypothetical protein PHW63_00160 [Alphaproteobacteria bacterium]|nr:hypothetical protein [Alphaproteobacteria bacterium]
MTKVSSFLFALVAFSFLLGAMPAKADTDIYVSLNSPYHARGRHDHGPRYHHRRDWRPEPIYYAPAYRPMPPRYMPPMRTVVYETTVVRPQTQYVVPASMMASQTSPTYMSAAGQTCREYTTQSWIGNDLQNVYGTACLQSDGAWRIVD